MPNNLHNNFNTMALVGTGIRQPTQWVPRLMAEKRTGLLVGIKKQHHPYKMRGQPAKQVQ